MAEGARSSEGPAKNETSAGTASAGASSASGAALSPLARLQRLAGNRAVSDALAVQRAYQLMPNKERDVTYTFDGHRAVKAEARNVRGQSLGPAANSPTASPFGWQELRNAGHTLASGLDHSSHYNAVRMHLINGRLGGPGDDKRNLVPGPAKINSMMSAYPETLAKGLVDAGNSVWLRTEVTYQGNSTNAHDFTSVVANRIKMEWGVEGHAGTSWETDIELPVAPLQGADAARYQSWASGNGAALVADLQSKPMQVKAQVFDLVTHNDLKIDILRAFPDVYFGMEPATKGAILRDVNAMHQLPAFLATLHATDTRAKTVEQVLLPLAAAGQTPLVQSEFLRLFPAAADQRAAIVDYKWQLTQHLGPIAEALAKTDKVVYSYFPEAAQAGLMDVMPRGEMSAFLAGRTSRERQECFNNWANERGYPNPGPTRSAFINTKATVEDDYKEEYESAMELIAAALAYKGARGSRKTGKPERLGYGSARNSPKKGIDKNKKKTKGKGRR